MFGKPILATAIVLGLCGGSAFAVDNSLGKPPNWQAGLGVPVLSTTVASPMGRLPQSIAAESDSKQNKIDPALMPQSIHADRTVEPFISFAAIASYVLDQRGLGGKGLPATYHVPPQASMPDFPLRLIVSEGVGLYDTSLSILSLLAAGDFDQARSIADLYVGGLYSPDSTKPMELRAYPSQANGGAFLPFDPSTYYFFDFTNVYGNTQRWGDRWNFWGCHTGPNAWMASALCRIVLEGRRRQVPEKTLSAYLTIADTIGRAMLRLQDEETAGGIRYSARRSWHKPDSPDPYDEINMENNLSAHAAYQLLARTTGKSVYEEAAIKIEQWLKTAPISFADGRSQKGLMDSDAHVLLMGVAHQGERWVVEDGHPTDAGGTWAISSLGPEWIDKTWGPGAAYRMWVTTRRRAGRTADWKPCATHDTLAGLDYTDAFPADQSLITPEWTAGGLYALRTLITYYDSRRGRKLIGVENFKQLQTDLQTMSAFISTHSTSYAYGPGQRGERAGATGFGWNSPPEDVDAMASVYVGLFLGNAPDPLGYWRTMRKHS